MKGNVQQPTSTAWWFLGLIVAWAAVVVISLNLCGDGFLHAEAHTYLAHHLSPRPVFELVFDNAVCEGGLRARELSHGFDWIDSRFIGWSTQHGHPHFFSLSHYLFHLVAGVSAWGFCVNYLRLPKFATFGFVMLIWTSPSAILYTSFFRSSKAGVFMLVFVAAWLWSVIQEKPNSCRNLATQAGLALVLFSMTCFDEQGLFILGVGCLFLLWIKHVQGLAEDGRVWLVAMGSLIAAVCYRWFGARALTLWLGGGGALRIRHGHTALGRGAQQHQSSY